MEPFPLGPREQDGEFEPLDLLVTDTFPIKGRGVIVVGQIRKGVLRTGDTVDVVRPGGEVLRVLVRGIEMVCGPAVRRDSVAFLLSREADEFVIADSVVRQAGDIPEH